MKAHDFKDTVYCIDEPEAHLSTRLQADLLQELVHNLPTDCQLWLATHSIGMMRRARDLQKQKPGTVVFLDFSDRDFDQAQILRPVEASRAFWERVLNVALDDLSALVAPSMVVVCEGAPLSSVGRKPPMMLIVTMQYLNRNSRKHVSYREEIVAIYSQIGWLL